MATKKTIAKEIKTSEDLMKNFDVWKNMAHEDRLKLTDVVAKKGGKYTVRKTPKGKEVRFYSSGLVCISVSDKASVALKSGHCPTLTINMKDAPDKDGCYTSANGKRWKPNAVYHKGYGWYQAVINLWRASGDEYDLSNNTSLKNNLEGAF